MYLFLKLSQKDIDYIKHNFPELYSELEPRINSDGKIFVQNRNQELQIRLAFSNGIIDHIDAKGQPDDVAIELEDILSFSQV